MEYFIIIFAIVFLGTIIFQQFKIKSLEDKLIRLEQSVKPYLSMAKEKDRSERWLKKIEDLSKDPDVKIVEQNDNMVLAEIKSYHASMRNGSHAWCISTSNDSWKKYVTKGRTQYFLFTKEVYSLSKQRYRRVGFTLSGQSNKFYCCFDNLNNEMDAKQLNELFKLSNMKFSFNNKKEKA